MTRTFYKGAFAGAQMAVMQKELGLITADDGIKLVTVYDEAVNGIDITGTENAITVRYSKSVYLYRALGLISEQETAEFHIHETARFNTNGVMIDCSRNAVLNLETARHVIRCMARMGMNLLMLYTEDTYEVPGNPYFGYMRGRYTQEELRELDAYSSGFGIELIPCIQAMGHLAAALKWPAYAAVKDTSDILLVDEPETYAFIEQMLAACRSAFTTRRIHIGLDEAEMIGRGKYYDRHGDSDKFELICRHLKKLVELCRKYDFEPIIWSDMFFKLANDGDYRGHRPVPEEIAKKIPENVTLVYWEYLREEAEQYDCLIKNHLALPTRTMFAGGAWKWMSYLPSITPSIRRTKTALMSCAQNGIKEVFTTAWGNDGSDAALLSILPVLQAQAELSFHEAITDEQLAIRLKTCAGVRLSDFSVLDMPEVSRQENDGLHNPNKYLLFQDVLLGLFDRHVPPGTGERYAQLHKQASRIAQQEGPCQYLYQTAASLFDVLALKAELGKQIKTAYDCGELAFLKQAEEEILPEVIRRTGIFRNCLEAQWMKENKPFGFEVQDQRLGGLTQRLKTAQNRLRQYLDGQLTDIPELEEPRLPFGDAKADEHIRCNCWLNTVTASWM